MGLRDSVSIWHDSTAQASLVLESMGALINLPQLEYRVSADWIDDTCAWIFGVWMDYFVSRSSQVSSTVFISDLWNVKCQSSLYGFWMSRMFYYFFVKIVFSLCHSFSHVTNIITFMCIYIAFAFILNPICLDCLKSHFCSICLFFIWHIQNPSMTMWSN